LSLLPIDQVSQRALCVQQSGVKSASHIHISKLFFSYFSASASFSELFLCPLTSSLNIVFVILCVLSFLVTSPNCFQAFRKISTHSSSSFTPQISWMPHSYDQAGLTERYALYPALPYPTLPFTSLPHCIVMHCTENFHSMCC
jgi:hypothetical protein